MRANGRLLALRNPLDVDLVVEGFSFGPNPVYADQKLTLGGRVRNTGIYNSGQFWIEFWGSYNRLYPSLDFLVCSSIQVTNLPPGGTINLSTPQHNKGVKMGG